MRVRWGFLWTAVFAMVCYTIGGWAPVARADVRDCTSSTNLPATVLVRSGPNDEYRGVTGDGGDPYVEPRSGAAMIPMRALLEALAPGVDNVQWNDATRTATFWFQGHTLQITYPRGVDRVYTARLDGRNYSMNSFICQGRVWAPVRPVASAFDVGVSYFPGNIVILDPADNGSNRNGAPPAGVPSSGSKSRNKASYSGSPIQSGRLAAWVLANTALIY